MRLRNVPELPNEEIIKFEYEPGRSFTIYVMPGTVVNNVFVPAKNKKPEEIFIRDNELIDIESNPDIANALSAIITHAWNRVDAKRAEEE